ncbi:hypothetical protein JAAARDRAFT_197085 [Jaapia argillacea MUCL 33604]|uniref:Uncharacterized protein n=1 Tax=Jaapia argillacea MUCL 33604 TaxID=933084 RepID=A0A067PRR3_9AGAM|nr:hypothetical protein JAAARDRAFT_197085 [Jaapia argillacea MUCL 33604]
MSGLAEYKLHPVFSNLYSFFFSDFTRNDPTKIPANWTHVHGYFCDAMFPGVSNNAFAHWLAWYTHVDLRQSVEHLSESCGIMDISLQWVIETHVPEFIRHSDDMPPQYIFPYERPLLGLLVIDYISNYLLDSLLANVTTLIPHTSTHLWHGGMSITPGNPVMYCVQ